MLLLGIDQKIQRAACRAPFLGGSDTNSISLRIGVCHPNTRTHVRLLGPCFKTGRISPELSRILVLQHHEWRRAERVLKILDPGPVG